MVRNKSKSLGMNSPFVYICHQTVTKRTYKRIYEAADAATQAKYDALEASDIEYRVKSDGSLKSRTGRNAQTSYNFDKDRVELTFDKGLNNPVGVKAYPS